MKRPWGKRLWGSVAFRLAVGYCLLSIASMSVLAAAFYVGTVGVLSGRTDSKLVATSARLSDRFASIGREGLQREVAQLLVDGIEQDTEVYLLLAPDGEPLAGNIAGWSPVLGEFDRLSSGEVERDGRPSLSRLLPHRLADGSVLVVGRDLQDRKQVEQLVWRALIGGGFAALLLSIGGALLFRRLIERRVGAIRRTAMEIEAGDLSRRIPLTGIDDEFARLSRDINSMLNRIEHLMDGVRHVSNAIAHDLRTPLGRVRGRLDEALRAGRDPWRLAGAARRAIRQIDDLIRMLDKVLQIAEAESGARRQSFETVALASIVTDVIELYDAAAEAKGITLQRTLGSEACILGDRQLLASALANLIDNAVKYAGRGATVRIEVAESDDRVSLAVRDDGPGIPAAERAHVAERFYRLDRSRGRPGNGLGLSIVSAIATLHHGHLHLEDGSPGLLARLELPVIDAHYNLHVLQPGGRALPNGNVAETSVKGAYP
jgi:signal transduction histidine kinase